MKKRWQVRSSSFSPCYRAGRLGELFFRIRTRGLSTICKYTTRMVGRRRRNGPMRTCSLVKPSSNHIRAGDEVEPVLDLPTQHACDQHCCQPNLDQQESTRTFIERGTKNDLDVYSCRMKTTFRALTRTPITLISWRLFFRRMQTNQPWHVSRVRQVSAWRSFTRGCTLDFSSLFLSQSDDSYQQDCESVQQVYRQSLEDAERETEERIRWVNGCFLSKVVVTIHISSTYQREQEQILKAKTDRLKRELDVFLG